MKIIISEKEFYEIDRPAQISINQVSALSKEGWADYNYFGKKIPYFKKRYNIKPEEVGLIEFPTSGAGQTINRQ